MIENIKARFNAQKFNICTEQIDSNRKHDSFLRGDYYCNGTLYYGHPLFIFFISPQNKWFKNDRFNSSRQPK